MGTNGTVTITAKVHSEDAERRLQALERSNASIGKHADQARDSYGRFTRESSAGIMDLDRQQQAMMISMAGTTAEVLRRQDAQREFKRTMIEVGGAVGGIGVAAIGAFGSLGTAAAATHAPVGLLVTGLKSAGMLAGPVAAVATVAALGFTAVQVGQEMKRLHDITLDTASVAQSKNLALQHVTSALGASFVDTTASINKFRDGVSGLDSLSHTVTVLNTMGLSVQKQQQLIGGLRDTLIAMGKDADIGLSEAADSILNVNTRGLKQLGVLQDVDKKFEEYAKSVSTTAANLTVLEKQQVIVNTLLERTGRYAGTATTVLDTHQGAVRRLAEDEKRLGETIGKLFLPFDTFKVKISDQIVQWKLWGAESVVALKDSDTWIARNLLGMDSYEQAIDTMLPKIAELQARNRRAQELAGQARSEGGYGPANTADTNKAYEERAKREQAANERAAQAAKQHAEEQKRQHQTLQDELLTINRTGAELELAQEGIRHRKELETAAGAHKNLELEQERHRRALLGINAKYPGNVMSGSNSSAPGLSISMGGGVKGLDLGSTGLGGWKASQGQAIPEPALTDPGSEWYASIKEATDNGLLDGVKAAVDADFGGLGQSLLSIMSKAPDPMIQAMVGPAGLAITFGAMIANSFKQAADDAESYKRHMQDLDGPLTKDEQRAREKEDDPIRKKLEGQRDSFKQMAFDAGARANQGVVGAKDQAANLDREAAARQELIDGIDRTRQATWDQADAYERLNKKIQDNFALQTAKAGWADYATEADDKLKRKQLQLAVLGGTATDADLAKFDVGIAGKNEREAAVRGGMKQLGLDNLPPDTGRKMIDEIIGKIEGGADLTSKDAFKGTGLFGGMDFDPNSESGKIIIGLAQGLKSANLTRTIGGEEAKRIGPNGSQSNPFHTLTKITNVDDFAFLVPGEAFRATGPGTRRADGMKGRAVNTRGV